MAGSSRAFSTVFHTQGWEIQHFSKLPHESDDRTKSPTFNAAGLQWHLTLYPGGGGGKNQESCQEQVGLFLQLLSPMPIHPPSSVFVKIEFVVLTRSGGEGLCRRFNVSTFSASTKTHGKRKLIERTHLLDKGKDLIWNDTVKFRVKMAIRNDKAPDDEDDLRIDAIRMANTEMLETGLHSDVALCVEGETIAAHKAMLASRSPVFKAMFAHKMSEANEGKVMIDDVALSVFRLFLRFLYTGQLSLPPTETEDGLVVTCGHTADTGGNTSNDDGTSSDDDNEQDDGNHDPLVAQTERKESKLPDSLDKTTVNKDNTLDLLLAMADRFQVADLMQECSRRLVSSLSADNVFERLLLADKYRQEALKQACLDFIRQDPVRLSLAAKSSGFESIAADKRLLLLVLSVWS